MLALLPDVVSFAAAASACEKCGQWQAAVQLLRQACSQMNVDAFCLQPAHAVVEIVFRMNSLIYLLHVDFEHLDVEQLNRYEAV